MHAMGKMPVEKRKGAPLKECEPRFADDVKQELVVGWIHQPAQ